MNYYRNTSAEQRFLQSGPFFHLCTKPLESDVLFESDEEKTVALNMIAISACQSDVKLMAFSIMSNHFHFILMGYRENVQLFWENFYRRLDKYFRTHGRAGIMKDAVPEIIPIQNLKQLRTEIAYVIRNSFVVRTDIHVFADPWSSGCLYFNPLIPHEGIPASALKGRALRDFTKTRSEEMLGDTLRVKDGVAQMWSFVDYKLTESFYDNARQFIHSVLKNVEALAEMARDRAESPFFSDDELIPAVYRRCREEYHCEEMSQLSPEQRKTLAVTLKNKYFASNKQIARLAKLPLKEVDVMFPLSAGGRLSGA